ncbi:MAG: UDP-N-acetylglucosamine 2-epimerase (hydrolyzing) [Bacteroidetes bacterium]|nr:UDP-N-acetylglucosamine 2-epimerase (hydrolyzing) [Bacteroidota bacterium]
MRIGILTSTRADFGIYLPLIKAMMNDAFFEIKIIAFGTHLSRQHGYTIDNIINQKIKVAYKLQTLPKGDTPYDIANCMAETTKTFSKFWNKHALEFDYFMCLGDRYEMFAAVCAAIPFNIKLIHLHGGETTLGAIDNTFRHCITAASTIHFTSSSAHSKRVSQIFNSQKNVFNVGALSLDNLKILPLLSAEEFKNKFAIDLNKSSVLFTFHPETVNHAKNKFYITEIISALKKLKIQIIITAPNNDTGSEVIVNALKTFVSKNKNAFWVSNFGTQGYFTCLSHCKFVMGNSSSGILEAASFGKYVINLGERQRGRMAGKNVLNCNIDENEITGLINKISGLPKLTKHNVYGNGNTSQKIISILKDIHE